MVALERSPDLKVALFYNHPSRHYFVIPIEDINLSPLALISLSNTKTQLRLTLRYLQYAAVASVHVD